MRAEWNVVRKPENLNIPDWEKEKTPEMQYRRELSILHQESAFQLRIPLYGVVSMDALETEEEKSELTRNLPDARAAILMGVSVEDPLLRVWHRVPGLSMKEFTSVATSSVELMILGFVDKLEYQGFKAVPIQLPLTPTNALTRLFELAGAGFTGKNHMVVTEKYGCRVALGVIVTDAPLLHGDYRYKAYTQNQCGDCTLCQDYCPSGALSEGKYDQQKCEAFIQQPENQLWLSEHTVMKCDMCMRICPLGPIGKWDSEPVTWNKILEEKRMNF